MFRIGKHPPHFRIRTQVIALMVPTIGISNGVGREVHGAHIIFSPGNVANKQICSIHFLDFHVLFMGQADAYLSTVMGVVPKVLLVFECRFFGKTIEQEFPFLFLYAQYDCTPVGIGKCRIGFPKAAGKTTTGGFELDFGRFTFCTKAYNSLLMSVIRFLLCCNCIIIGCLIDTTSLW